MDKPLIEELYNYGYNVISYEPLGYPKRKPDAIPKQRKRLESIYEVEVPGLGMRLVRFGNTGWCKKCDNCFKCQAPVEECNGGDP